MDKLPSVTIEKRRCKEIIDMENLNEEALHASMEAVLKSMYGSAWDKKPFTDAEWVRYKNDNEEEYRLTISAYLAAIAKVEGK